MKVRELILLLVELGKQAEEDEVFIWDSGLKASRPVAAHDRGANWIELKPRDDHDERPTT